MSFEIRKLRPKGFLTLDRAIMKTFAQFGLVVTSYRYDPLTLAGRWTIEATTNPEKETKT